VLRTLHTYIGRDLLRITCLSVVSFTMVMTVFAIIEPLRKSGLAAGQVGMLFGYTLPVMVTLTLPFAALFATTIVYGRFSQDREMLACRASGISVFAMLKPALALGLGVSIITLTLTNFVSPGMARQAQRTVMQNIRRIAYHLIQKESHVKFDKGSNTIIVHATQVDEDKDVLVGVVAGRFALRRDPKTGKVAPLVDVLVAKSAALNVKRDEGTGKYYASVAMENPVGPITNKASIQGELKSGSLMNFELDNPSKDKPAFFDWGSLISMYRDPTQHSEIKSKMERYRKQTRRSRILQELTDAVNDGGVYGRIRSGGRTYDISAGRAKLSRDTVILTSGKGASGLAKRVAVRLHDEKGEMLYQADRGKVVASWDPVRRRNTLMIELMGRLRLPGRLVDRQSEAPRKSRWDSGSLPLPRDEQFEQVPMVDLLERPGDFTTSRRVIAGIDSLTKHRTAKIRGQIEAEMNFRIAYGLSCALLVAMGAALGVISRGGQFLTAFAISVIPAAGIIVMILMGKRMISNPDSSTTGGYIVIWGGMAALLLIDIVIYYRLGKR